MPRELNIIEPWDQESDPRRDRPSRAKLIATIRAQRAEITWLENRIANLRCGYRRTAGAAHDAIRAVLEKKTVEICHGLPPGLRAGAAVLSPGGSSDRAAGFSKPE
jgi:hypothetical protein